MTNTNVLNRKLEEVYGVGKEFTTVAALWGKFNALIRDQQVCVQSPALPVPSCVARWDCRKLARWNYLLIYLRCT